MGGEWGCDRWEGSGGVIDGRGVGVMIDERRVGV